MPVHGQAPHRVSRFSGQAFPLHIPALEATQECPRKLIQGLTRAMREDLIRKREVVYKTGEPHKFGSGMSGFDQYPKALKPVYDAMDDESGLPKRVQNFLHIQSCDNGKVQRRWELEHTGQTIQ